MISPRRKRGRRSSGITRRKWKMRFRWTTLRRRRAKMVPFVATEWANRFADPERAEKPLLDQRLQEKCLRILAPQPPSLESRDFRPPWQNLRQCRGLAAKAGLLRLERSATGRFAGTFLALVCEGQFRDSGAAGQHRPQTGSILISARHSLRNRKARRG